MNNFAKSDMGAQAAWKGFSSQTLYIALRIVTDKNGYAYYPEDIEDLVIKSQNSIIEAVQVKNVSADLTMSHLSSTKTSKSGEGFYKRMCSIHTQYPEFNTIKIVYFNGLGSELSGINKRNESDLKSVRKKLVENHGLTDEEADWFINSLVFEKVDVSTLEKSIAEQIKNFVPVMAAPNLAKDLLIQYVSMLSNAKGFTTFELWNEKIHQIGMEIAALDGFYKEYHKSLVRLSELQLQIGADKLSAEYLQGVSAHPSHIRENLDIKRNYWIEKIKDVIEKNGVAIVKGVSGQGKTSLCYRYLIDSYPESNVFCVRSIENEKQAENLVVALHGLGKHNQNLIIYIDVKPGETRWIALLQELQIRGLNIPVLISIRDEDFNLTSMNGISIRYGIVELCLSVEEAEYLYEKYNTSSHDSVYRSFEDAWNQFGGNGPLIEFIYVLTSNQTLKQRLCSQIDSLLMENISDDWMELLQLVCYAGRLGCAVNIRKLKTVIGCQAMHAAIRRFKDEYLIRMVDENTLEALHPVRAHIITELIERESFLEQNEIIAKLMRCIDSRNIKLLLMDYFSKQPYSIDDVTLFSKIGLEDWIGYANFLKAMLWLDTKRFVEQNMPCFTDLIKRFGSGWFCFMPNNISGVETESTLMAEVMRDLPNIDSQRLDREINQVKEKIQFLTLDYQATDCCLANLIIPRAVPQSDIERSMFGYSLFWISKRGYKLEDIFENNLLSDSVCSGSIEASADAIRGLFEHESLNNYYLQCRTSIEKKLISEMNVLSYEVSNDAVSCKFVPPTNLIDSGKNKDSYSNQYWRIKMLDILKQLYPDKEFINIELVGVHLMDEIGIDPMDYTLHIHKSRIHSNWITELNCWAKNRIDYSERPLSWNQYVSRIDAMRKNILDLATETIRLIDDIYQKGRYRKERWQGVERRRLAFFEQIEKDYLLPQSAVDPYCLYAEGNAQAPVAEYFTMRQLLSVSEYEKFRTVLSAYTSSFSNFYNQFAEILMVRIKKECIESIPNLNLAIFNLFKAAKSLADLQKEYARLFSNYTSLHNRFDQEELESVLTLLNVWQYILENPAQGFAIAYNAKQRYRKGISYFRNSLENAASSLDASIFESEKNIYLKINCDLGDEGLESGYTKTIQSLKMIFNPGKYPSSDRWYSEMQSQSLAFLPAINDVCLPTAYSLPFYKIFDDVTVDFGTMIPCEVDSSLFEIIYDDKTVQLNRLIGVLGGVRLTFKRYHEIIQTTISDQCIETIELIKQELINQITEIWEEFNRQKNLIVVTETTSTDFLKETMQNVNLLYDSLDGIIEAVKKQEGIAEIMAIIEHLLGALLVSNISIAN